MSGVFAHYPSLNGRPVIITGGATGIGKAFVEAFLAQGAPVAFIDFDKSAGEALACELSRSIRGGHVCFYPTDVTDIEALQVSINDAAARMGGLGVLIANAANDARHTLDGLTSERWDACFAVNLKHQFFAVQAAYPHIAASGGGSIICLGSISWLNNTIDMVGYSTAKSGVHGLVRILARQLGPSRIRVNALVPGWTMTERQERDCVDAAARETIAREQCIPAKLMPEHVAQMALFLAADDSAMCTQQVFVVDGGWI